MTPDLPLIPLSAERLAYWRLEIKKARQKRRETAERNGWDDNLKRYLPPEPRQGEINTGVDFADVESKKAALLFDSPSVALTDPTPGLEQPVVIHQELLNALLGPEHADVQPVALKAIFNCLCPAGIGPVLVGYHCVSQRTLQEAPVMGPDGQPLIDPQTFQPVTQPQPVDVPIAEKWFVTDLSPKAVLIPAELRTTAYQKAASWLGYEWEKPVSQIRREFGLSADWHPTGGGTTSDRPYFKHGEEPTDTTGDPAVAGVTLWYRAHHEVADRAVHPERLRKLTLLEDGETPLEHHDSADQDENAWGQLSPQSVMGFPVRPLVLRDLSDAPYVPSDCAVTASLTKEQQKYRRIALEKRDHNRDVILYDAEELDPTVRDKIEKGTIGQRIPVKPGALANGVNAIMQQVVSANQGRETYLDQNLIKEDRSRILAIDNNQTGINDRKSKTATESTIVQRNTDARFEQGRARVLKWYLYDIVKPFDALVLRYCDEAKATEILGPQKGAIWAKAKPFLAGGYRYTLQMDSGKYIDVEDDRRQMLQIVNFAAKAPFVNQQFLWRKVAEKFGYDPTQFLAQPEPPRPEPPKLTLSFKGEDLSPGSPQSPIVLEILASQGLQISQDAIKNAFGIMAQQALMGMTGDSTKPNGRGQPEHGGAADKAERIDQHQLDESGALPGPGPM